MQGLESYVIKKGQMKLPLPINHVKVKYYPIYWAKMTRAAAQKIAE